jgi:hypothetical protein
MLVSSLIVFSTHPQQILLSCLEPNPVKNTAQKLHSKIIDSNREKASTLININFQQSPKIHNKYLEFNPGPQVVSLGAPVDRWITHC